MSFPEEVDETWQLIQQLPIKLRTAVVLRYYMDLPVEGIAELMDTRPGTVKSLLHRGRETLPGGNVFHDRFDGTEIRLLDPIEEFPASAATFTCNDFTWAIEASDGQLPETLEFIRALISILSCR